MQTSEGVVKSGYIWCWIRDVGRHAWFAYQFDFGNMKVKTLNMQELDLKKKPNDKVVCFKFKFFLLMQRAVTDT